MCCTLVFVPPDVDHPMGPMRTGPSVTLGTIREQLVTVRSACRCRTLPSMSTAEIGVPGVAELAATRRPVDEATLLPPRVFHEADVFEFERESWFSRTWL